MTELHPIPIRNDDDDHWDARAARVAHEAVRRSAAGGFAIAEWRASWIAASLLFAAGLVLMVVSANERRQPPAAELRLVVAPADDVGRALALPEQPPPIGALLFEPRGSAPR